MNAGRNEMKAERDKGRGKRTQNGRKGKKKKKRNTKKATEETKARKKSKRSQQVGDLFNGLKLTVRVLVPAFKYFLNTT